jgi:hypothetical protein
MTEVAAFIDGLPKAVDQADLVAHIWWQCLDDIGVERIDHGVRNSFQIAWLTPADRAPYLTALDTYVRQSAPT